MAQTQLKILRLSRMRATEPMELVPVESKAIRAIGYDHEQQTLYIEFCAGRTYSYAGVPREVYEWLLRAPGKGGLFNRLIRDKYREKDVTESGPEPDLLAQLRDSLDPKTE
jgi:KTSC domain